MGSTDEKSRRRKSHAAVPFIDIIISIELVCVLGRGEVGRGLAAWQLGSLAAKKLGPLSV
jgi:hypothetical protein